MARPVTQGIPQDWTIHSTNSQMPISLLVELYKVANERLLLTLRTLHMRRQVVQTHKTGQEWFVRHAEEQAKNNLKHQYMLGSTIRDRDVLVTRRHGQLEKADMREMCCGKNMVQAEIRNVEE